MDESEHVVYEETEAAAWITLDRPDALNALTEGMLDAISTGLERAERDEAVRVVVIRGNEKAFSAGYDIGEDGTDPTDRTVGDWLEEMRSYPLLSEVYELDRPVVAAVDGYALAGGCNLALVCDLTIVTERAQLGYTDARMGSLPAHFVHPFVIGSIKHARELYYSGKTIDGEEAARMNMVNRAVPHGSLMEEVRSEIEAIRKTPGTVVSITKAMLNDVMERQGFRPRGRVSEHEATLTALSESANEFYAIREEEGLEAAIDWMHTVDK